jgi:hypothetical protein
VPTWRQLPEIAGRTNGRGELGARAAENLTVIGAAPLIAVDPSAGVTETTLSVGALLDPWVPEARELAWADACVQEIP